MEALLADNRARSAVVRGCRAIGSTAVTHQIRITEQDRWGR